MPEQLLERAAAAAPAAAEVTTPRAPAALERRVRADLGRQIALLERRLAELFAAAFPRKGIEWRVGAAGGPRVLGIAELERVRDALAARLRDAEAEVARRGRIEEQNRALLEEMIRAPERHRGLVIGAADIGEASCRTWRSEPRLGIIGMLMGWWRVKISSGCPLATGAPGGAPVPPASASGAPVALASAPPAMARRSRKRRPRPRAGAAAARASGGAPEGEAPAPDAAEERPALGEAARPRAARSRYRDLDERPRAPWAPFPLVELVVLVALVLLVAGFAVSGHRGTVMIGAGLVLGTLAGLELSIREHFAGYRSHTALLAAAVALAVLVGLTLLVPALPLIVRLVVAVAAFAATARFLVRVFQRRSGLSFKFR